MNEQIRISPIRLIGAEGEQHGIVPTSQAQEMAREAGMDLVEVAAQERPPVCKIMDYGKFKYAQSKKTHQKTHQQKLKEIRVRPKTGDHDIQTKINQARQFLDHNDKVQVNVLFRGREMQHIEEGQRVMAALLEALVDVCKVESPARMEGKRMVALLAPKVGGTKPAEKPREKPAAPKPPPAEKAPTADKAPAADKAPVAAPVEKAPAGPEPAAVPAPVAKAPAAEKIPAPEKAAAEKAQKAAEKAPRTVEKAAPAEKAPRTVEKAAPAAKAPTPGQEKAPAAKAPTPGQEKAPAGKTPASSQEKAPAARAPIPAARPPADKVREKDQ